jgi:pseudaminic acid synthase
MIIDDFNFNVDNKTSIICELSANHSRDINIALKSIEIAKEIGANAVKIQTYTPDTMTIDCDKEDFVIKSTIWDGSNL